MFVLQEKMTKLKISNIGGHGVTGNKYQAARYHAKIYGSRENLPQEFCKLFLHLMVIIPFIVGFHSLLICNGCHCSFDHPPSLPIRIKGYMTAPPLLC